MADEKKLKCDCGADLEEKEIFFYNTKTKAFFCPVCDSETIKKDQAKEMVDIRESMH
ncbi:hypothetical protein KY339_03425 [Candidatus Woesearchaeota archaeon]|nr:hypothetical protein [Candidatus Woesearchaeota archaeon]